MVTRTEHDTSLSPGSRRPLMPSRRAVLATLAASATTPITTVSVTGCGGHPQRHATVRPSKTKISYLTGFQDTPREQYARVALAKGYFDEVGLEVTIHPGQPADFNFKQVEAGKAQFASVDFVSAVKDFSSYHYQVVAAIHQSTLLGLASLSSRNITVPADLDGKSIGTAKGGAVESLFPVYAKLAGINPRITWRYVQPDQIGPLLGAGKVDLVGTYLCDAPNTSAAVGGREITTLPYEKFLTDLFGTVVIAGTDIIATRPEVVRAFAAAITKGIVYACDHPEEAGRIIQRALPVTNPEAAAQVYQLMKPYVGQPNATAGTLAPVHVMKGIAILESGGIVAAGQVTPEKLVAFDLAPKAG
jgi:NitT/TauT family transport system substrate-binding protein